MRGAVAVRFGLVTIVMVLLTGGYVANSGVVPIGHDIYMLSRQAATGFSGSGNLKGDALREANAYCDKRHLTMQVVTVQEAEPPYIFGNFPKAEVQFKCVPKGD